jgi:hypothetical protein
VILMDHGRVLDAGSVTELLKRQPAFRAMLKHHDQPSFGAATLAGIAPDRPAANQQRPSGRQAPFISAEAKPCAGKQE